MTDLNKVRQAEYDLIISFLLARPSTQIRVLEILQNAFPEETKKIYTDFIDKSKIDVSTKRPKEPITSFEKTSFRAFGLVNPGPNNFGANFRNPRVSFANFPKPSNSARRAKGLEENEELIKEVFKGLEKLKISPTLEEISNQLYQQPVGLACFIGIIHRYCKIVTKNNSEYLFSIAVLLNEAYVSNRNLACLFDPRDVELAESFARFLDVLRIPSFWGLLLIAFDVKNTNTYQNVIEYFPPLKDTHFLEFFVFSSILNSFGIKTLLPGEQYSPDSSEIANRVKNSTAYRQMGELEKSSFFQMMKCYPYLLLLSTPNLREEMASKSKNSSSKSIFEILATLSPQAIRERTKKAWEYWAKRKQWENDDDSKISKAGLPFIWSLKTEIFIILKFIEVIPVLGPKKKLLDKLILKKLEKIKKSFTDFEIFNYHPFPTSQISKTWAIYSKLNQVKNEIICLIITIKRLMLVLQGVDQPYFIYGNLKNSILTLLHLFIEWIIWYIKFLIEWEKQADKLLPQYDTLYSKIINLLSINLIPKQPQRLIEQEESLAEQEESLTEQTSFYDFVFQYFILPLMLWNVLKYGPINTTLKPGFESFSQTYVEATADQIPTSSILIFEEVPSFETSTMDKSKLKSEENSNNVQSQDEIMKKTVDSLESQNFNEIKKSPKKHRIFIRIPSLTRNKQ